MTMRIFMFRVLMLGMTGAMLAACEHTAGGLSGENICYAMRADYQKHCNHAEDADRRDCEIALKTEAMARVDRAYPLDRDNPDAAATRGYLISSIDTCSVRTPIDPIAGTGVTGYWNAVGPDIFGQDYVCEGAFFDLEFTSLGSVLNQQCDIVALKRMTLWRLDRRRLVLFNDDAEIIYFKRAGSGWRSLDGKLEIYR